MRNISTKKIGKVFGGRTIFSNINMSMPEGKKLALVGENGAGKSTLLKILCGLINPDEGEIFGLKNGCVYIAQDFSGNDQETPFSFLNRRVRKVEKAIRMLENAGFNLGKELEVIYNTNCQKLSGGERKKLEIVAGLASGATFIALDEPENHLDYETIEWLVGVLSSFRGGLIFVSHDQYLTDRLADTILELEDGAITVYTMKYDEYLAEKERQIAGQTRQWIMEKKTRRRLQETVEMMKMRAKRNSDTASTYQQTKKRLQKLEDQHGGKPSAEAEKLKARLALVDQKKGKSIVSVCNLSFSYGHHAVFKDASAELRFGERVVLFGSNGSGKSTLLNLLIGQEVPASGSIKIGVNVNWQMMTQDHLAGIDSKKSPLEVFRLKTDWPEYRCRAYLARYGIKSIATSPLEVISGGQRARFKLALIFAQNPEFLILDEPTNHIDPPTWEAIVEAIQGYSGTVLAVTHDRSFIDAISQKLWIIQDKKIQVELGNLSEYLDRRGRKS